MNQEVAQAFVGLGGNLGDVQATLADALFVLDALPQTSIRRQSRLYRSAAWGGIEQPDFINAVVELRTRLTPRVLLDHLLGIEARFGRIRSTEKKWGPRALDLDLLVYGMKVINEPGLHLPHPYLHERAFVLVPLVEIAPKLLIPKLGQVDELLARIDKRAVQALGC